MPACFQRTSLQFLTNDVDAHLIPLRVPDINSDSPSQIAPELEVAIAVSASISGFPSASFTDVGKLVKNFVKNYSIPVNLGCRQLLLFLGKVSVASGEEDF